VSVPASQLECFLPRLPVTLNTRRIQNLLKTLGRCNNWWDTWGIWNNCRTYQHLQDELSNKKSSRLIAECPDLGVFTTEDDISKEFEVEPDSPRESFHA